MHKDKEMFDSFIRAGKDFHMDAPVGFEDKVMERIFGEKKDAEKSTSSQLFFVKLFAAACVAFLVMATVVLHMSDNFIHSGVTPQGYRSVSFRFRYPGAKKICLVGDFNKWNKNRDNLTKVNGHWKISKVLKAGRFYKYAFLVDNRTIIEDVRAKQFVADGFGGRTSVVFVN